MGKRKGRTMYKGVVPCRYRVNTVILLLVDAREKAGAGLRQGTGPAPAAGTSSGVSLARATRTLCTRGAQGMLNGCTRVRSLYSPCASGVLPLYTARYREEEGWEGDG